MNNKEPVVHLAGVFRPGKAVELYVNGELAKSQPVTVTEQWIENGLPVNIGRRPEPGTPWRGDIDEARIYGVVSRMTSGQAVPAQLKRHGTQERACNPGFTFRGCRRYYPADGKAGYVPADLTAQYLLPHNS